MWRKKLLSRLSNSLSSLVIISLFASGAAAFGQDPTGQPTEEPKGGKKPSAKKPVKAEPLTVILTVLTDPPESSVYINGEQRGVVTPLRFAGFRQARRPRLWSSSYSRIYRIT